MDFVSAEEIARLWDISPRSVRNYCAQGRIADAILKGKTWMIPVSAVKPKRKARFDQIPQTIAGILKMEMESRMKGGLYHRLQIDFTYNSNHMEGSRLTHEQTRWIFETMTVGKLAADVPVDDIIETSNHFRCIDKVIGSFGAQLTERYIKNLHFLLKNGTSDSRKAWFAVGDYKRLENVVGDMETCPAKKVHSEVVKLLTRYNASDKTFEDVVDFHVRFERIHPFQDGNGRVGRLIMLKECLKNGHVPFVIAENLKQFYYMGLEDWRHGRRARLLDTCRTGQDVFVLGLRQFGHAKIAAVAEKTIGVSV